MRTALYAFLALPIVWAAPAQAGFLDIFRREKPPEPEGMMLFGLPLSEVALTAGLIVIIGGLLIYRPRILVEMLTEAVGQALAWVLIVLVMIAVVAGVLFFAEGLPIAVALVGAVIVMGIVVIGSLFD